MPAHRIKLVFIKEQIEKVPGYKLLSTTYKGCHHKLEIQCGGIQKHIFYMSWSNFKAKHRCLECSRDERRLGIAFVGEQIRLAGYILLSTEYKNEKTPLTVKCNNNHEQYITTWNDFQQEKRCAQCYGNKKLEYDFIKKKIEEAGYTLISTEYENNRSPIIVKCDKNHEPYETTWDNFQQKRRCKKCYHESQKLKYDYIKQQIEKVGYTLISTEYIGCYFPLEIRCDKNHLYKTTWSTFRQGCRCPKCNSSKGEMVIENYLKNIGLDCISQYRNPHCRNVNLLPFDFYIPSLNLKIEYDGREHDEPIEFFGGEENFKKRKINDTIKNKFCIDNKIVLLRINHKHFNDIEKILSDILFKFVIYYCFFEDDLKIQNYLIHFT